MNCETAMELPEQKTEKTASGNRMSIQGPTLSRALSKVLNPIDSNSVFSSGEVVSDGEGGLNVGQEGSGTDCLIYSLMA